MLTGAATGLGPTIDELLTERADTHTNQVFLRFASGDLTFAEVHDRAARLAAGLASIGVESGATGDVDSFHVGGLSQVFNVYKDRRHTGATARPDTL